ncbi:MAG TPA: DUF3667 domain-containing protein [Thermoanaerobaculia bacterium]|nr:DUF3667 domain-containing protein [Thermoanaerobaculia bacterium]
MSHDDIGPSCLNCGTRLHGKYCHACGQKAVSASVKLHDFVHEATHEFLHLDGKIVKTLKLLVAKPGQLTVEFLEGRRSQYVSPLRVYLTFSLIFFTLAAILPRGLENAVKVRSGKELQGDTELERRLATGIRKAEQDTTVISNAVLHHLPKIMFLLMPVFALIIWAFYRKQQRFYIPHLYYSVHFHAFVFLVMSVFVAVNRIGLPRPAAAVLVLTVIPYHFIALRRVYGGSRGITLAKGFAAGFFYWLIAILCVLALTMVILVNL